MLKIAIVNDTAIAVEALHRVIEATADYCLLWVAHTGTEAVRNCDRQRPDVILMDLNMPELDGVEATRQIMQRSPCAILIVTASITHNTAKVLEAMGHGALDVVLTPALGTGDDQAVKALLKKITIVAQLASPTTPPPRSKPVSPPLQTGLQKGFQTGLKKPPRNRPSLNVPQHPPSLPPQQPLQQLLQQSLQQPPNLLSSLPKPSQTLPSGISVDLPPLIVMGASTGGPHALKQILSQLPGTLQGEVFKAAIVVIQHIDGQFTPGLVDWLNQFSRLPVALARNGDRPEVGKVLVAGTNNHLNLRANQTLRYTHEPADVTYRPSIDVFFGSVARHWPRPGMALLLTGMGRDGAEGMARLHSAKWYTIAESEDSCVVFSMPKAAIERGATHCILPLPSIAPHLVRRLTVSGSRL
ncbi:MAG: chemotaxis protein CheB [Cyanobacteria bacterium P01_F01_bin.53]